PGRLEQELVLSLQKLDVDEELDRLDSHVAELRRVLRQDAPVGRRLDFLLQEFNREANTLGSKSVDARTSAAAVELKVLIDQIREQPQNIEGACAGPFSSSRRLRARASRASSTPAWRATPTSACPFPSPRARRARASATTSTTTSSARPNSSGWWRPAT